MSEIKRVIGNQAGMVSFTVTFIMMIVITLIVLGFSQVTQRNARESLDRQLSAQAFYAAESGINVTTASLRTMAATGLPAKTSCPNNYDGSPVANLSTNVRYTCVLVDPHPNNLTYTGVTPSNSVVAPLLTSDGSNIKKITFKWTKQTGTPDTNCTNPNVYTFPPANQWNCGAGVLRIDLLNAPDPSATNLDSDTLLANTVSFLLTPYGNNSGAVAISGYSSPKTFVVAANGCSSGTCSATLTLPGDSANYYARMVSLYREAPSVVITGSLVNGTTAHFTSQAIVDVTGQAQDELRRVQARVQLTTTGNNIPLNAVASSSTICKHFMVVPGDTVDASNLCQ